ncbi:hypothetical protein K438DRAFT_1758782 [Mycena galopus ATCC 62051]|nr:hypothetical protein K438DRAFT_1758782 [Mycena galopus ATCC 62051]
MLSPLSLSFSPPSMLSVPAVRYRSNSAPAKPSPPSRPGFIRGYCSSKETDLPRCTLNRHWVRDFYRQCTHLHPTFRKSNAAIAEADGVDDSRPWTAILCVRFCLAFHGRHIIYV